MRRLKKELWPHCVTVKADNNLPYEYWLVENMGPIGTRWNVHSYNTIKIKYYFRSEKDAVMFSFRWL